MFIGHVAVGLAAKRLASGTSLGLLVAAPLALDLLWPALVLAGCERVRIERGNTAFTPLAFTYYPWSHSLLMALAWSLLAGTAYWMWTRYRAGAIVLGAGVLSHWVLDAVVHRPDLPLYPGSTTMIGLGLWNSVPATLAVECAMFAAGVWLYASHSRPLDRAGRYGFWAFVAFLVAVYAANAFGPPPPSVGAVAFAGLALWLLPLWAWWFDSRRAYSRSCTG
jgi:membrane-bound metal-dependent hydrolase YbcI (DUF457 family)